VAEHWHTFTALFSDAGGHGGRVQVPEPIAQQLAGHAVKRVVFTIGEKRYHRAIYVLKHEGTFLYFSKPMAKELKLALGDEVAIRLKPDDSEWRVEVPEEFAAVLESDPEGEARFRKLTDGAKRTILFAILKIKNSDLRIERSLQVMDRLKLGVKRPPELLG
jgi:hypothetical protein